MMMTNQARAGAATAATAAYSAGPAPAPAASHQLLEREWNARTAGARMLTVGNTRSGRPPNPNLGSEPLTANHTWWGAGGAARVEVVIAIAALLQDAPDASPTHQHTTHHQNTKRSTPKQPRTFLSSMSRNTVTTAPSPHLPWPQTLE